MPKILTAFRIEKETKIKLKELAKKLEVSESGVVRMALNSFIKKHNKYEV